MVAELVVFSHWCQWSGLKPQVETRIFFYYYIIRKSGQPIGRLRLYSFSPSFDLCTSQVKYLYILCSHVYILKDCSSKFAFLDPTLNFPITLGTESLKVDREVLVLKNNFFPFTQYPSQF